MHGHVYGHGSARAEGAVLTSAVDDLRAVPIEARKDLLSKTGLDPEALTALELLDESDAQPKRG